MLLPLAILLWVIVFFVAVALFVWLIIVCAAVMGFRKVKRKVDAADRKRGRM